ncbi:acyl carrier protein [Streptomyces sp. NPDC002588]|uniref:acyl carrier protein n=1 Tax=Streptomyces sp. NPDC002588 TaxID=3154419 RepID=UPI003321C130
MSHTVPDLDQVVELVTEIVGHREITADSNFFDAGGDSLTAAHLSLLLEERFGTGVDVFTIYASEDLREIHTALLNPTGHLA